MYNQGAVEGAANIESGSRIFVYEVVGLRQNEETDQTNYPIRKSGSVFIRVPYNRMNQEMQRITRLGGKIVSIQSVSGLQQLNGKATPVTATSEVNGFARRLNFLIGSSGALFKKEAVFHALGSLSGR